MVKALPRMKKAPGNVRIVAEYRVVYIGAYTNGVKDSATPTRELSFPIINDLRLLNNYNTSILLTNFIIRYNFGGNASHDKK